MSNDIFIRRPQPRVPVLPKNPAQRKGNGNGYEEVEYDIVPTSARSPILDIPPPSTPPPPPPPLVQSQMSPQMMMDAGSLSSSSSSGSGSNNTSGRDEITTLTTGSGDAASPPSSSSSPSCSSCSSSSFSAAGAGSCTTPVQDSDDAANYVTLDSLVERLFSVRDSDVDTEFMETFVLSMNLFVQPEEFLGIVIDQLNEASMTLDDDEEQIVKRRVFRILTYWVKELWNPSVSPKAVEIVRNFTADYQLVDESDELIALVDKTTAGGCAPLDFAVVSSSNNNNNNSLSRTRTPRTRITPPPPPSPSSTATAITLQGLPVEVLMGADPALYPEVNLLNYDATVLAQQITIVESAYFRRLKPWEFQGLRFAKKDTSLAPNVHALSAHFNNMSMWVARNIMGVRGMVHGDWALRARVVEKAIDLAHELCKLQNYNGVYEVISACESTAVTRLKRSWEDVSERHKATLKELVDLLTPQKNYAVFRRKLRTVRPPCVPYIGLYQTDMTFSEDGNKSTRDGLVNWYKCGIQAKILSGLHSHQRGLYALTPVPFLLKFFSSDLPVISEDDIWDLSYEIEPRGSAAAAATTAGSGNSRHNKGSSSIGGKSLSISASFGAVPATPRGGSSSSSSSSSNTGSVSGSKYQFREYNVAVPWAAEGFVRVPLNREYTCADCKRTILEICLLRGVGGALTQDVYERERASGFRGLELVAYSSRRPYSAVVPDGYKLGEIDGPANGSKETLALCRAPEVIRVLCPKVCCGGLTDNGTAADDLEGHFAFEVHADAEGAGAGSLLQAVVATAGIDEPFAVLHYRARGGKFRWLNVNFSLHEQEFDARRDIAVLVCPNRLFVEAGDRVSDVRSAHFMRVPRKDGPLNKAKSANVGPTGLPRGLFSASGDEGVTPRNSGLSSSTVEDTEKNKWVSAVDNMLFVYKNIEARVPSSVYLLDCCDIELGTTAKSGREAIVVRDLANTFFAKSKRKPIAFTAAPGGDAAAIRTWFSDLIARSKVNIRTRAFGLPLKTLAERDSRATATNGNGNDNSVMLPMFVRNWFDFCVANALALPNAFAAAAPQALLDTYRAEAEAGRAPRPTKEADIVAYAQLGLLFLCDLPTPLIPSEIKSRVIRAGAVSAYEHMGVAAVRALLDKHMPQPAAAATLFAYLAFFRLWAERSGAGVPRAAEILGKVIFREYGRLTTAQAAGFTEEMLRNVTGLGLLERAPVVDAAAKSRAADAASYGISMRQTTIASELDATLFYAKEMEKLTFLVANYSAIIDASNTLTIGKGVSSFGYSHGGSSSSPSRHVMSPPPASPQSGHDSAATSPITSPGQSLTRSSCQTTPRNMSTASSPSSSLTNNNNSNNSSGRSSLTSSSNRNGSSPSSLNVPPIQTPPPTQSQQQQQQQNPSLRPMSSRSRFSLFHRK